MYSTSFNTINNIFGRVVTTEKLIKLIIYLYIKISFGSASSIFFTSFSLSNRGALEVFNRTVLLYIPISLLFERRYTFNILYFTITLLLSPAARC